MNDEYVLDTNILIYTVQGKKNVLWHLEQLNQEKFYISALSRMEFLLGAPELPKAWREHYLNQCVSLPMDAEIADEAAQLFHKNPSLKFKDAVIAATAKVHKKTLLTADKGFKKIKSLRLELLQM